MKMHIFISILPDIDECSDGTHNCSQTCTNTEGGFYCGCNTGFVLDDDGATCNGMYTNMSIYHWLCENQSFLSAIFTRSRLDLVLLFLIPNLVRFLYKIANIQ